MKKKILPKDQTKELSRAKWAFMKRNQKARDEHDKEVKPFRDWHKKHFGDMEARIKAFPKTAEILKKTDTLLIRDCDALLMDCMQVAAAYNGNLTSGLCNSWREVEDEVGFETFTPLMLSSRDSSPIKKQSSKATSLINSSAARMPTAMGRSKPVPSFLISAGAKLMVTWLRGKR